MTSYQDIQKFSLRPKLADRTLAKHIEVIRELYTIRRDGMEVKEWSEEEVTAYASFYLPTNQQKFSFVMDQLTDELKASLSSCQVIDFGTGPGTYLLSFLEAFGGQDCGHLYGVDINPTMMAQAEKLLHGLYPDLKTKIHFQEEVTNYSDARGKLMIFGNSLNELDHKKVFEIIKKVRPDFLLFIEPGIPTVFDEIIQLRTLLKGEGWDCHYPCPSMNACPLVKEEMEETDWCHQVWRGTHEPEVEHLAQLAKIDRRTMPFIGHLYSRKETVDISPAPVKARFIRFISESKHSFEWEVCVNAEDELKKERFEIPKKLFSKKEAKEMKKISVGTNFDYEVDKTLGNGVVRLKSFTVKS
ncbi:unnamed protein product [Chrysoparadoxa australica]